MYMEASSGSNPSDLGALRLDVLRRAAEIYLEHAYPSGQAPEAVHRRMAWSTDSSPAELLSKPPFERAGRVPGTQAPIYALRLGNSRYPHMKLQIQPWPNANGLMLSVNTHDQVAGLDLGASDGAAFKHLQAENQHLKEVIEQAWEAAGLPTFLQYLREYIETRTDGSAGPDAEA
jgi:hypothetical protein